MACKPAQDEGYYGDCVDCPLPVSFCDDVNRDISHEDIKKYTTERNKEIRILATHGYKNSELKECTGLKCTTLSNIISGTGHYNGR